MIAELKGSSSNSQATTAGVPVITEETPLPPGDDEVINPQELFMEVVRFNMGLNVGADGITNQLAQRLGLENINHLPQASAEIVAQYKQIFDQVKGIQTLPEAIAVVDMLCPAQS